MADGTVIDKLQIEIEASAKDINTVLTTMENNLARLQKALNGLDNSKFLKTIKALQDAMKNVNGQSISPKVNTSSVDKTQAQIEKAMQKIQDSIIKANSLAQAAFNGDSSSATSYERKAISIQGEIDVLRNKLQQLSNVEVQTEEFIKLDNQIEETRVKLEEAIAKKEEFQKLGANADPTEYANAIADVVHYREELDKLIQAQQDMLNNGTATYRPYEQYNSQLQTLQDTLSNTRDQVNSLHNCDPTPKKVSTAEIDKLQSSLKDVLSTVRGINTSLINMGKKVVTTGLSGVKTTLSGIQSSFKGISSATSGFNKVLNTGFMKILRYGFGIRSLYVLFRRLKTAIKDSFTELQKSGAEFQTTKANVEALKTSLTTLKYQFGAAFEPIFNTIAPALQTLINYLVAVMNTMSAFIAKITGRSTYSKVKAVTAAVAENTGAAASNAKELNKQLQGFDELNNISPESNGGSGGGGGGSSDGDSITYEEASVESALGNLANTLAEQIRAGDWKGVGTTISTSITDALNSIDWDSVKGKASAFGTNLADFVCGLVTPGLFSALGTTLAESIKTALTTGNSFATEMNKENGWNNLGYSVAKGIKAFVDANPLSLAVDTFSKWANGILTSLVTAVRTLLDDGTINEIGQHIADAINNFDAWNISFKLGTLANELAQAFYILVSDKSTWSELANKISDGIKAFFAGMNQTDSVTGKTGWEALKKGFINSLSGLKEVLSSAITTLFEELSIDGWDITLGVLTVVGIEGLVLGAAITKVGFELMMTEAIKTLLGTEAGKAAVMTVFNTAGSLLLKVAGAALVIGSLVCQDKTTGGDSLSDVVKNSILDTIGAVGMYAGLRMIGVPASLSLKIAAAKLAWEVGTNIGLWIGKEWAQLLADEGLISSDASGEYIEIAKNFKWKAFIDDIELAYSQGNLADAWADMVGDWFDPLFSEIDVYLLDGIKNAWNKLIENIKTVFDGKVLNAEGENAFLGIANGFWQAITWGNPVLKLFNDLVNTICEIFGIESPAKEMYQYGEYIFEGIIEGFKKLISGNSIVEAVSAFFEKIKNAFDADGDGKISLNDITVTIKSKFTGVFKKLDEWTGFSSKLKTIKEKYSELKSDFKTTLSGKISEITDFDTLTEKVENFKNAFVDKVVTFTTWLGGQVQNITVFDSWRSKVSEFKNVFTDSSATFKAYVGGQVDNIEGIVSDSGWRGKISNFKKSWENSSASTSFNVTSNINDVDKSGGWKDRLVNAANTWKNTNPTSTFKTSLTGSLTTADDISTVAESFKTLKENYPSGNHESSWSTTLGGASVEDMNSFADAAQNIYNKFYTGDHSATWTMTLSNSTAGVDAFINNFVDKLNQKLKTVKVNMSLSGAANGGVILASGKKLDIPQYAGGTLNAGSMFIAGEHGPEILGHINGRTEVLNRSQIASTMNHAIVQGMSQFRNMSLASPESLKYNSYSYDGYANGSNESQLLTEQNSLIREQNDLLRQLLAKDPKVGVDDVFSAVRSGASDYYNRTGNSPFVF